MFRNCSQQSPIKLVCRTVLCVLIAASYQAPKKAKHCHHFQGLFTFFENLFCVRVERIFVLQRCRLLPIIYWTGKVLSDSASNADFPFSPFFFICILENLQDKWRACMYQLNAKCERADKALGTQQFLSQEFSWKMYVIS